MLYVGEIEKAYLLNVVDEPRIQFVFGFIVYDLANRFDKGDWIATSNLIQFKEVENGFAATTQNCTYLLRGQIEEREIVWEAVENIRTGTNPDFAMQLYRKKIKRAEN